MKALRIRGIVELIDIPNELKDLQHEIGGYIESLTISNPPAVMLVDEEGMMKNLCYNMIASLVAEISICGPALIVGMDGDDFTDVPEEYLQLLGLNNIRYKENGCAEHCPDTAAQKYSQRYHNT